MGTTQQDGACPNTDRFATVIVVMGVAGCGKSSVGKRLAEVLDLPYQEGDDLHPRANIEKMSAGLPLTDEDRWPWLDLIGDQLAAHAKTGIVLTCSALKRSYRDRLRQAAGGRLAFVFLDGSRALLAQRMGSRTGHFMPTSLLDSQFAALERPDGEEGVVTVDIDETLEAITAQAVEGLRRL